MSSPFVGRTAELAALDAALAEAAAGRGSTLFVCGEAGIGKSRLVAELSERARGAGATVLCGRCLDLVGTGVPYLPLAEAVRPVRTRLDGLPELARLTSEPTYPATPTDRPVGQRPPVFGEVRALLDRLAETAPVVLVLEDLHWADASTLDLVSFLAHAVGDSRVLLVGTYRVDEVGSGAALRRLAVELYRARVASSVELPPLSRAELETLLAGARLLRSDEVDAICVRSQGNPFFAEELIAAGDGGQALPRVLRDALLQRVAHVGAEGRAVLRVAVAVGGDVRYGLVVAVAPLSEAEVRHGLREAVDHLVLVADQRAGTFRFRHALLAEAVYSTLLPGERDELHARIAEVLTDRPALASVGSLASELARHWAAAGRPAEAFTESIRAARAAEARAGRVEALSHLERAIALWPAVPDAAELAGMDRPAVYAWAAELGHLTGRGRRAAELIRRAIDDSSTVDQVRVALWYERLGSYLLPTGDRDGGLTAFRRAVELVPDEPKSADRVRVLAALANALSLSARHEEATAYAAQAIADADAIGEDQLVLRARDVLGLDLCYLGRADEGLPTLRKACAGTRDEGSPADFMRPHVFLSDALLVTGELASAAEAAEIGLGHAYRLGLEQGVATVLAANLAEALVGTGDWTRADAVLAAALGSVASFWSHSLHIQVAQLATYRGEFDVAREHLDAGAQAAREPPQTLTYACLEAELAIWQGRPAEVAATVDGGLRYARSGGHDFALARLCAVGIRAETDRVRLAAARHDAAAVTESHQRAGQLVEEANKTATRTPDAQAWASVAEAEFADVDPVRWDTATRAWEALGRPYLVAYCRWRHASALVAAAPGSSPDAVALARTAHRAAVDLGADPLRGEVELLAQRARLDLVGLEAERPADPDRVLGLTSREDQVLQLVARGYTNREIATELTISVKTASVHVSHILRKLGIASRFEAAEIAHRLRRR